MIESHRLFSILSEQQWVEIVEVIPPRGADGGSFQASLDYPANTVLAVADAPKAEPLMAAVAACVHAINKGYSPIMTINCRDYNRIALQSLVLGAVSLGVKAFFIQPGLHQTLGTMKEAKNVYDVDPVQALRMLAGIRDEHVLSNGESVLVDSKFAIGIQEHPVRGAMDLKAHIVMKKIRCGADFLITDPIADFEALEVWRNSLDGLDGVDKLPIFIGLSGLEAAVPERLRSSGRYAGTYRYAG